METIYIRPEYDVLFFVFTHSIRERYYPSKFPSEYTPPRNLNARPQNLSHTTKYDLEIPMILKEVIVGGNMLGTISILEYEDHEIIDANKFPCIIRENYLRTF